jgi:GNAT superfamily N-acetyltransferase
VTSALSVRPIEPADRERLASFLAERWGTSEVVAGGRVHRPERLPGLLAEQHDGTVAGAVTWLVEGDACELITIDAVAEGQGLGTALLEGACAAAATAGCRRIHLTTTNDNLRALAFYQHRGFALRELRAGAIAEARRLKPEIPLVAGNGIPIRDELVLERPLS